MGINKGMSNGFSKGTRDAEDEKLNMKAVEKIGLLKSNNNKIQENDQNLKNIPKNSPRWGFKKITQE